MVNQEERMMAALIYIASFFTAFIGPLIIWLLKRSDSDFIDYHGREYLNFLISYTIYGLVASLLMLVLIGFVILPILGVAGFIFTIIAAVKAYDGEKYRIPLILRIL